jgi:5-methylthioadenosine/S-adenosylhomocysteine deaminase
VCLFGEGSATGTAPLQAPGHVHKLIGIDLAAAKSAVANTVDYARTTMGEQAWQDSLTPELVSTERIPNP